MAASGFPLTMAVVVPGSLREVQRNIVMATVGAAEYTVTPEGPRTLILTRRYVPTWAVFVGALGSLFLVGLLAFRVKSTEHLTITLARSRNGTKLTMSGTGSQEMIHRLSTLQSNGQRRRNRFDSRVKTTETRIEVPSGK